MPRKSSKRTPNCAAAEVDGAFRTRLAAAILRDGGVIAHATEAVFGLAASAWNPAACARVARLKRRPAGKRFIVISATPEALWELVDVETPLGDEILASWPGPNTWIVPARPNAPVWLRDDRGRVAVRVTAHPQAAALCRAAGLLVSTSANPPGRAPARTRREARAYFGGRIDFCLGGLTGPESRPTRIRDGLTGAVVRT